MADNKAADFIPLISREQIGSRIGHALRLYVGRGRRYSVKELANATGIKDRVIECAMCDPSNVDYRPLSLEALASIGSFLGAQFNTVWLKDLGQGAYDLPDDDEPRPGDLAADNSDDNAAITRAAKDGVFDREERKDLSVVGVRLVGRGARLVAMGRAA